MTEEFRPSYVYLSRETDPPGRLYIGYRKCPAGVSPWEDTNYMGSYTDKTFNPSKKTVLYVFLSQIEAKKFETFLQKKFDVLKNKIFCNKSISAEKFLVDEQVAKKLRKPKSESHRENIRKSKMGSKNPMFGKPGANKGKIFSAEWKNNLSLAKNPKKFTWVNKSLNLREDKLSVSEMIAKYKVSKTELYRLTKKEKLILKASGWEIEW